MGPDVLSGIGMGIGLGTAYGTIVELLRTATTWVKWRALGKSIGYPKIAQALNTIQSAEKDEIMGLTPKGIVDVIYEFINHTMDMAVLLDEGVATQLFVQMIQQSIAYAIHASHAGSIGTAVNVFSGGTYLSPTEASQIGENIDLISRGEGSFLSAEAGQNVPTLAFSISRGVNRRIEDVYRSIMRNVDSFLDEWNDLSLSYYRHYHSMAREKFADVINMKEAVVNRAYGLMEQIANEHLARIAEQLDTLEGAKAWFDSELMNVDELKDIAVRVNLERQASESNYNEHKEATLNAIEVGVTEWDDKVYQALKDIKDSEIQYSILIRNIFSTIFADVTEFVNIICDMADKNVEDVCAYRNVSQAIKIKAVNELGVEEFSPEVELYRMRWIKWKEIPPITVIYEHQKPSGLKWGSMSNPSNPNQDDDDCQKWESID